MSYSALFQHHGSIVVTRMQWLAICVFYLLPPGCQARAAQLHPQNHPESFQQVQTFVQQGRLDEAKEQLLKELKSNPSSVNGYNLLGIIESNQQDLPSALAAFQKALQIAPNSTKTHNNLGNLYIAQNRPDLAEKEFRTVLHLDPANPDGNYDLGVLLMAKGLPVDAIPCFERVGLKNSAASLNLIRAYFQARRTAQALRLATDVSKQATNDVKIHFSLGVLLASEGQYKPAQLELEKADVLSPGTFEIVFNLGEALLRDGNYSRAEVELTRALQLKPDSSEALYSLAQVYKVQSKNLDALDLLVRANKIAPENADIILLTAQISISQKYFEDAIPLLEKGLQIAPQRSDLRSALGESYFKSDKIDKAVEQFIKVIAVAPSARDYAFLGLSYAYLGRFDEAKQNFRNGLNLEPQNSFCLFHLGYIAERQGETTNAENIFLKVLRVDPDFPYALLELANLRAQARKFTEAEELLKRYIRVSGNPASGYYRLAMVERSLHNNAAADQALATFQSLSKGETPGAHIYEHLYDYLDSRSKLSAQAREQQDLDELLEQNRKHPDQPDLLYHLAAAYLKSGAENEAKSTIDQLDKVSSGDYRTLAGTGVLLARYRMYDDSIQHFRAALALSPQSDEVNFDLANAYFRKGRYSDALDTTMQISELGRNDDACLALVADIYAHLGDTVHAEEMLRNVIKRNPDNDQDYLSLALLQFRKNEVADAKQTLLKGQVRIPASGKILWGLGLVAVLEGNAAVASAQLERAVDMLPEWPGSYSTLGVFYFQTGQIAKAREILNRFKNSNAGGLDVNRIQAVLARTPEATHAEQEPLQMAARQQLLQMALSLADKSF